MAPEEAAALSVPPRVVISVHRLTFAYPGLQALTDVSFQVRAGAVAALVGPNGAGKTTLLRCLAALVRPLSGQIRVNGVDIIESPRECHTHLGFLPDFFGLYEELTVERSLRYFALAHRLSPEAAHARVEVVLDQIDLTEKRKARVGELSRGMRQRLGIGQALVHDPPILLLDEPASGLDPEARHRLAALFRRLQAEGKTLLVSSHILSELNEYATDLLVLRNGRVSEAAADGVRRVRVRTLEPAETAAAVLTGISGVSDPAADSEGVGFELHGSEADLHRVLRSLLDADLSVVEYAVQRDGVRERYLRFLE
ncbi:MAG: ABC transporter ATP-binding protein [Desulfococcaceae bacterium]